MKRIFIFALCFIASPLFAFAPIAACPQALPTSDANFCPTFKQSAICFCTSKGVPASMCQDVNKIYSRMISMYGSQQRACQRQKETSYQVCMDDWNCFRQGGTDSTGKLCSATGSAC